MTEQQTYLRHLGEAPPAEKNPDRVPGHHIPGWMQPVELFWLNETARFMDSVLEIGSWRGRSTYALAEGCAGPVYAVDHWGGGEQTSITVHADSQVADDFRMYTADMPNIQMLYLNSDDIQAIPDKVDMVFIDGAHDYGAVKADIERWGPRAKLIVCGHDWDVESVRKAVVDAFGSKVQVGFGNIWYVKINDFDYVR